MRAALKFAYRSPAGIQGVPAPAATWDPYTAYSSGQKVALGGKVWQATTNIPRGLAPCGVGDGSTADRNLLLLSRSGFAESVTGGLAAPTYTVTTTADSGAGSLRTALESTSPFWIVFDKTVFPPGVPTTITFTGQVIVGGPNKTVDGRGSSVTLGGKFALLIQGATAPTNAGTNTLRFGADGTANIIVSHLTINPAAQDNLNRDCITLAYGFDLVWIHHVEAHGSTDGVIDITGAADPGLGQTYPAGKVSRVTVDWAKPGPYPDANMLARNPPAGINNEPTNGKVNLVGAANDTDPAPIDACRVSYHHMWWYGGVQRHPKLRNGWAHLWNCYWDRWGMPPGLVENGKSSQIAYYTGIGKTAVEANNGTVGAEVGIPSPTVNTTHSGLMLLEYGVFRPYQTDEPHVADATWPMHYPDTDAIVHHADPLAPAFIVAQGNVYKYGATTSTQSAGQATVTPLVQAAPSQIFTVPYAYRPFLADDTLSAEVAAGAGNVQPWALVP